MGVLNNQHTKPKANILRHFIWLLKSIPLSARAAFTMEVIGTSTTCAFNPISV